MKLKYRAIVSFDLNLVDGEKLQSGVLKDFKEQLSKAVADHTYFYTYVDGIDGDEEGSYDSDVSPANIKCKLEKRK